MSREKQVTRLMVAVGLAVATVALSATASAQEPTAEPCLVLTGPASELQLPDEPERRYAWPTVVMSAGTIGLAVAPLLQAYGFCFSPSGCTPQWNTPHFWVPAALGGVIFSAGLAWLVARVIRFRRAHRVFDEVSERLAW